MTTARSVEEWIGDTPDQDPPQRVKLRVFDRHHGRCWKCTKKIRPGERWECDHKKALINGGENRENNLGPLCCNCIAPKNAADVAEKSAVATKRKKHLGLTRPKRSMDGSRNSNWKKPMYGPAQRRDQ